MTRDPLLLQGDCREVLAGLSENSVDSLVTDPPYGLEFMGKEWDRLDVRQPGDPTFHRSGVGPFDRAKVRHASVPSYGGNAGARMQEWHHAWAAEALRVLKPGGHLLAFGGTRTYHRLVCALEDAGFEIRDTICWLYGSGFPKSLDVSKAIDRAAGVERERVPGSASGGMAALNSGNQEHGYRESAYYEDGNQFLSGEPVTEDACVWKGWGTALKPAFEPIVVARKPLAGTVAANVLAHGVGALNVDGCRIAGPKGDGNWKGGTEAVGYAGGWDSTAKPNLEQNVGGRWPANVALDEEAAAMLDEQTGTLTSGQEPAGGFIRRAPDKREGIYGGGRGLWKDEQDTGSLYGDSGGASRFFFVAQRHRLEGCERVPTAEPSSSHDGPRPASVPSDAAIAAHHADSSLPDSPIPSPERSTSETPSGSRPLSESAMPQTRSTEDASSPASPPTRPIPTDNPASVVVASEPIDTTTTTPDRSLSAGSADDATSEGMSPSRDPGEADSLEGSRFRYVAKASRAERNAGLDGFEARMPHDNAGHVHADGRAWDVPGSHSTARANHHPTVKPVALMRWLVRLVTPAGGLVVDPFAGSGTTGVACALEGFDFIGVEMDAEYLKIAEARIRFWAEQGNEALAIVARRDAAERIRQEVSDAGQLDIFALD